MKGFKNTWIVTEEGLRKTSFTYDQHFITIGRDEEGLEELPEDYVIGGSLSSPVCGSLTETRPSGISAGCAAVRGDRGKSGFDCGLRKGCDTA